jgi:hypothetical protein
VYYLFTNYLYFIQMYLNIHSPLLWGTCGQAWVHVLSFVDADTISNRVGLVSHAFHALATEPQLWRHLVLRDFPASSSSSADSTDKCNLYEGEPDGWRKTYAHHWLKRSVHANQSQPDRFAAQPL